MRPGSAPARVGASLLALLAGLAAGGVTLLVYDSTSLDFLPVVATVAAVAWAIAVLPLVLFVDHGRRMFAPGRSILVGALSGVGLFLLFLSAWFLSPPWYFVLPPYQPDFVWLYVVAAVVGAGTWETYCAMAWRL